MAVLYEFACTCGNVFTERFTDPQPSSICRNCGANAPRVWGNFNTIMSESARDMLNRYSIGDLRGETPFGWSKEKTVALTNEKARLERKGRNEGGQLRSLSTPHRSYPNTPALPWHTPD